MKAFTLLFFLTLVFSCKKDEIDSSAPAGALARISVNGKTSEEYEFTNGRLTKENMYFDCDTPRMIFNYTFSGGQMKAILTKMRGLYSSSLTELCNPNGKFEETLSVLKYNQNSQVVRKESGKTFFEYKRNAAGQIEKITQHFDNNTRETILKYDIQGNLAETRDSNGITRYQYDSKTNPYFQMERWDDLNASPYNGPNNVIKALDVTGKVVWERKFKYNSAGLPTECEETNGITYSYHYN